MFARIPPHIFWPGMVFAILGMSVIANVVLIVNATSDGGPQIVPDYYSKAVHWDEARGEEAKVADLGWDTTVRIEASGDDNGYIYLGFEKDGAGIEGLEVGVTLRDPAKIMPVFVGPAAPAAPGHYVTKTPLSRLGVFDVEVLAIRVNERFHDVIRVEVAE